MLNPGNYMLVSKVNEFIGTHFDLYAEVVDTLPTHQGELGKYYDTNDLRSVIYYDIFVEMECDCVTYMILEK
jgi:hypothetical protein